MSTEDGRQPLMMITTLNQLEELREVCGVVVLSFGSHGWVARAELNSTTGFSTAPHPDLGEAVQELYLDVCRLTRL